MKLFTRYSRINLLANIAIFLVASFAFYFSIHYVLVKVIDEDLEIEEDEIRAYVKEHNRLPESFSVSDQMIVFTPVVQKPDRFFSTALMKDKVENTEENFRRLTFGIVAAGQTYRVDVMKSLEGTNNLLRSILLVSISTILAILLVSAVINRVLLKKLWQPFYASLRAVQNFRPSRDKPLSLSPTSIEEFNTMNETLENITKTSRLEYLSLKTFSENASHEIQTPIAIIRSKLDLLIQDENLTESQSKTLQSAYNAIEKLSRLNGSLLLLAKIENRQFEEVQQIDLKEKLEGKLDDFQELWQAKGISFQSELQPVFVNMNKVLAEILLNNLLSNATNHNYHGGCISIILSNENLSVSNTSTEPQLDTQRLFQRFYKTSTGSTSNGLGLSIIKQIAEASGFVITYSYISNKHTFTVHFHPANASAVSQMPLS
jgi:signal transduction histidine kinase